MSPARDQLPASATYVPVIGSALVLNFHGWVLLFIKNKLPNFSDRNGHVAELRTALESSYNREGEVAGLPVPIDDINGIWSPCGS